MLTLILSHSSMSRTVICNTLVENWDHTIFPNLYVITDLNFINNKDTRKDKKHLW